MSDEGRARALRERIVDWVVGTCDARRLDPCTVDEEIEAALSSAFSVLSARADRWKAAAKRERASADLQSALVREATNRAAAARAEGEARLAEVQRERDEEWDHYVQLAELLFGEDAADHDHEYVFKRFADAVTQWSDATTRVQQAEADAKALREALEVFHTAVARVAHVMGWSDEWGTFEGKQLTPAIYILRDAMRQAEAALRGAGRVESQHGPVSNR
jgi:hypothetical protein